jgi:hypothetical protein
MRSFTHLRVFVALVSLATIGLVTRFAFAAEFQAKSASVSAPGVVTAPLAARTMPPPDAFRLFNIRESRLADHHRPTPLGELPLAMRGVTTVPTVKPSPVRGVTEVTDPALVLETNRALSDTETNNTTSEVGEPSLAVRGPEVLITANWFAAFSTNNGATFTYVNPDTTFPQIPNQPFCCDQVAVYVPKHDVMFWYLQYVQDGTGNTGRLAVAQGPDIATQQWRFYDFTPRGVGNWSNEWFDFPALAVGEKYLYITTNVFSTPPFQFTRAVILRLPLDKLAAYQGFTFDYFDTTQDGSLRPTPGAADTMYFGTHVNPSTIRVFSWPENGTTVSSNDVAVEVWSNAPRVAPGPDGRDWLGRADPRMTAAWLSGEEIGFAWTASQDANFPFPHVRVAVLNKNTKAVTAQPHLWNPNFAFAYPAAAPNANGVVGISVAYGGGSEFHPGHAVGVLKPANSGWGLVTTANGTHGPAANRWGDYLAVWPHGKEPASWVATGFTLRGGPLRTDIEPRYLHFRLGEVAAAEQVVGYEYAAKIVCGVQRNPEDMRLARGFYATAINIHNPHQEAVQFSKKLALTFPPEEQKPGEVQRIAEDELRADEALEVDCMDIQQKLFPNGFPTPYVKGFVVIQSRTSLDVTAVYSAASLDEQGRVTTHSSIDVEPIHERTVKK